MSSRSPRRPPAEPPAAPLIVTDLDRFKAKPPGPAASPTTRRFYAPIDDVHAALVALINAAQHSLTLAMYGYDDDELAALIAHALDDPTIFCSITLDKSQSRGTHEAALLAKYKHQMTGNSVAIGTSEHGAIMHRKMLIIDGVWLADGSTNWSTSGETLQDNQLTITYDPVGCAEATAVLAIEHDHALAATQKP
jgi:phosphatidylserine/phosphatidylglycerophosphate/cardiolipin synthase-like enzyme